MKAQRLNVILWLSGVRLMVLMISLWWFSVHSCSQLVCVVLYWQVFLLFSTNNVTECFMFSCVFCFFALKVLCYTLRDFRPRTWVLMSPVVSATSIKSCDRGLSSFRQLSPTHTSLQDAWDLTQRKDFSPHSTTTRCVFLFVFSLLWQIESVTQNPVCSISMVTENMRSPSPW